METSEYEADDPRPEGEDLESAPSGDWGRPLLLAGIGLVLMLGGYAAMNYVPAVELTPKQAEQERLQNQLRDLAAKRQASSVDSDALGDRLDQIAPPWRTPRYEIPGRLAVFLGLFLFVAAGVLMYRQPSKRVSSPHE